jgi:hypothetical protein
MRRSALVVAHLMAGLAVLVGPNISRADAHGEIGIGRTATNQLIAHIHFEQPAHLPRSFYPGFPGHASALIGFANVDLDDPDEGVFTISATCDISARLTGVDPGIEVHDGFPAMVVGQSMAFGPPFFDYHPVYTIPSPAAQHGEVYTLRFVLHDSTGTYTDSDEFTVSMTPACEGDFDLSGAVEIADIFGFLNAWFAGYTEADFDRSGGLSVSDVFDFLNGWFSPCP